MTTLVDELDELAQAAGKGDERAFELIVRRCEAPLRSFVAGRIFGWDLIDEVVQSSFVIAFEKLPGYQPQGKFLSWLMGIARNRCLQILTERSRQPGMEADSLQALIDDELRQRVEQEDASVDEQEERQRERLQDCLARLPERSRRILMRHHVDGLPLKQLAQHFSRPQNSLAKLLFKARQKLRSCIESRA